MADEARLLAVVEANTKQFENALKRLEGVTKASADRMTASVKKIDQQLGAVGVTMNRIGKAVTWTAAIGAAKQLAGEFVEVAKRAGDLADAADKIGVSTKSLQELRYAAKQSGVDIGQLDGALSKLSKGVSEARTGSGDLRKLLLANGMSEAELKALSFEQALAKVADLVRNAKDATDAARVSTLAFGKANDELVNMLRDGAAGLTAFRAAAEQTGQVLGEDGVRKLAAYDDKLQELTGRWDVAVDHMVLYALTALEKIGEVEHKVAEAVSGALTSAEDRAKAAGAAAGASIKPAMRIAGMPTEPTGTASAALAAAAKARADALAKPTVVPPAKAGGGGGTKAGKKAGAGMTTITTAGGLKATVDARYADQFQGLLDDLEARGYDISGLSSLRPGALVGGKAGHPSQHRYGKAIDINPAINRQSAGVGAAPIGNLPPDIAAIAAKWGLRWGGEFRRPDTMHFDVRGKAPMSEEELNTAKGITLAQQKRLDLTLETTEAQLAQNDALSAAAIAIENANQAFKRDLVGGFIKDLERGVKPAEALANALQKVGDRLLDMALNSIFPDVVGGLAAAPVGGGLFGKLFGFAGGGVMGPHGPVPLKRYQTGGVASGPQLAMYGEGSRPEAYVPLPDGRHIPVKMGAGSRERMDVRVHAAPSPLLLLSTEVVARRAGHAAVSEAGDSARRRAGGR